MLSRSTALRRSSLAALTLAPSAALALATWHVIAPGPVGIGEALLACLFVAVMCWEGLVAAQVLLGFVSWARGPAGTSQIERRAAAIDLRTAPASRTAIVIPVFDEDVVAVSRIVEAMRRSLLLLGSCDDIDLHILSDSRQASSCRAEVHHFGGRADGPAPRVHYRHRLVNTGRKAGNIGEFLNRTRGTYEFAIVLDADSLMSGRTARTLIRLMQESPSVGLIQTISYAAGRRTLFARIQQFAVRLHAHLALKGMAYWQGSDGLYYGHNAIIRCEPFLEHAQLPVLPGRPPLGGEILCHDVVEAALLLRAGWEVRTLPDLDGTWEEMPTNVIDLLGRERRWCQGNLQHLGVVGMPGLTWGSRLNIWMGIAGYLVGPLWWTLVIGGAVLALASEPGDGLGVLAYGATETGSAAAILFGLSIVILAIPRFLNVLRALLDSEARRAFGGASTLLLSAFLEQVFSVLLAPNLSLVTLRFVGATFIGRVEPWSAQSRDDRDIRWGEALRILWLNVAIGLFLLAAAAHAGGWYAIWTMPIALALLSGPALVVLSSRRSLGERSLGCGLFLTIDDTRTADEITWSADRRPA